MSTRPKFFLLDAGPVIELHRLGLWQAAVERAELILPSVVCHDEVQFWDSGEGVGRPIDLSADVDSGRVQVIEATVEQAVEVMDRLDVLTRERIHSGELEAIACLATWMENPIPQFCTADAMAVTVLCLLGLSEMPVSLEEVLQRIGLGRRLATRFSARKMEGWVAEGRRRCLQEEGLA